MRQLLTVLGSLLVVACGGNGSDYSFDRTLTTFVVTVNPVVNDATSAFVTQVGEAREIGISIDDGLFVTSDENGIAIFPRVTPGVRTMLFPDDTFIQQTVDEGDVRDLVVAYDQASQLMGSSNITSRQAVPVSPGLGEAGINDVLDGTNELVIAGKGKYDGVIELAGDNITLMVEDGFSADAEFETDFVISGSFNRVRGLRFNGNLTVTGSGNHVSFSTVKGTLSVSGRDALLLGNKVCVEGAMSGTNLKAFDNEGLLPLEEPGGC
jgi:hypothetical protein